MQNLVSHNGFFWRPRTFNSLAERHTISEVEIGGARVHLAPEVHFKHKPGFKARGGTLVLRHALPLAPEYWISGINLL